MVVTQARRPLPEALYTFAQIAPTYGIGNVYHLFPTMQTERQELEIFGSYDGAEWEKYEFRYKPGAIDAAPRFVAPHQPRLNWMMWFVPPQSLYCTTAPPSAVDAPCTSTALLELRLVSRT